MTNEWMILQNWGKCKDCPKSVQPDAVKLTELNVPWWWTNPVKSRSFLVGYTYYFGGFSTVGNTSCTLFWKWLKVSASLIFSTFLNHSGEDKKSHRAMSGSTGVDAPVECGDWQKTATQVQCSALVVFMMNLPAPDCHFLGCVRQTASRRCHSTSK